MPHKANIGDVFIVPITVDLAGLGQVAGKWNGELYLVIFEKAGRPRDINKDLIHGQKPLFAALSLDAKIYNGDWVVVENITENLKDIPHPFYKVNHANQTFVESRDRSVIRLATEYEAKNLRFRTIVAPIRLENALKAANGFREWATEFNELYSDYAYRSSKIILTGFKQ